MIFCLYESKLCVATLVFYTCFYFPLLQIKHALYTILGFFLCLQQQQPDLERSDGSLVIDSWEMCSIDLPMSRYRELINTSKDEGVDGDCDELSCSVCLVEFEDEDFVSQLSKCGHIFHMVCIEKWVERNQFTCPLCRSSLLSMHGSNSHATCNSTFSCISS